MENARHLLLSVIFLSLHVEIKAAGCPSFNITYPPMRTLLCPGDIITYTCTFSSNSATINTQWTGSPGFQCSNPGSLVNTIALQQAAGGSLNNVPVSCGGNLSAVMTNISGTCYTSVLTIPTPQYFNGTTVICKDGITLALIGSDTLNIQLASKPGAPSGIQNSSLCTINSLTIQWTPATSGGTATSYNISVTSGTTVTVAGDTTMTTIGDLIDGTNYTVSVTAINCAGSSTSSSVNVQTLPCAPVSVSVTTVLYQNKSVYDVELFWTHRQQSCSVPQYTVMVTSATSTDMSAVNANYCNTTSCSYVQSISGANVNSYNVSVACRNTQNQIGQPYVAMQNVPDPDSVLQVNQSYVNVEENIATITCRFPANSSLYCMVCCSTVPAGSVSLVGSSSTNGPTVRVTLRGFNSPIYYCKAAATNTNSNNCAGPVVGGVKVFFSFTTSYMPPASTPTTTTTSNSPEGGNIGAIAGGVVGGVGGALLLVVIVVIVVVVILKTKGGKGGGREDTMELGKSGSTSTPPPGSNDGTGALYQDPKAIQHVQGPGGETYAMADKPTKTSTKASDKAKKPTATVAPVADAGGAMYQDPKDIQHTTTQAGETYAVTDKKPKTVGHVQAPAGDLYAVADAKRK